MRRDPLFLDTSYAVALLNERDTHHTAAVAWAQRVARLRLPLVTSEVIFLEVGNAFARADRWVRARRLMEGLRASSEVQVFVLSESLFERGWNLRCARQDQDWGIVDCTSFEIMREVGCWAALTADQHFAQAGFKALLLE